MKILITGGSGFLGQYLNLQLSQKNEILTLYNNSTGNCLNFNSEKVDIRNGKKLAEVVKNFDPEIIIHTAAVTASASKLPPKEVFKINVDAVENIAKISADLNCRLIYTSTDLVYAGYRGSMLKEDSKLIPATLYAETKLMGEEKIKRISPDYLILRTALLYGMGLNNSYSHFDKLNKDLQSGKKVKLFTDQFRTPLSVIEAAEIIEELTQKEIKNEIINFGGVDRVSRFELGKFLCDIADYDKHLLIPIKMKDIPNFPEVEDVSMNTAKLQGYGIKQKTIAESIKIIMQNAGKE